MAGMSDYLEDGIRTLLFRTGAGITKPAALYIALHTADPLDTGAGTEVSGGGYARVQRNPGDANWSAPDLTGGLTANVADITFPTPSANWGVVTHVAIWDAVSGGNLIGRGALSSPKTINNGDAAPKFLAGSLSITLA